MSRKCDYDGEGWEWKGVVSNGLLNKGNEGNGYGDAVLVPCPGGSVAS